LILDEPFNGLDPIGRHEMTEVLRDWVRGGRSLILASHILHEVEAISPSFLLIRGGRLLASGPSEEIHALLADVPNEIRLRCDKPAVLARRLVESGSVESVRFAEDDELLLVSTLSPVALFEQLPGWVDSLGVQLHELRSADDSLQRLFSSLMRMHRGESS
jgi:ABC-2 type transport system ATP-binding protein